MNLSFRPKDWVLFKPVLAFLLLIVSLWVAPVHAEAFSGKYNLLTDFYPDHIKGMSPGEMNRWAASATDQSSVLNQSKPYGYGRASNDSAPPDWKGIKRDTFYYEGLQLIIIGALYVGPESISGWSNIQKDNFSYSKWQDNVTEPVWDKDKWWINYVLHPYWGSAYYTRGRERGFGKMESFFYSTLLSSLYEFGYEALFEPVSIQDLIITPVLGSVLGYYTEGIRKKIKSKDSYDWMDKSILILTDPLGAANQAINRLVGYRGDVTLRITTAYNVSFSDNTDNTEQRLLLINRESSPRDYLGMELYFRW